jgi:HD-GYP domain-containing protein (c-di-GMP phosphodiesterase class II)
MPREASLPSAPDSPNFSPRLYGIAMLVAAIVVTGVWLIGRFTAIDLARDMQTWQEKLNLIAESRTAEVNKWVGGHFKELHTLAANPSLQLYLTELQSMPAAGTANGNEPAQKSYLRNLLLFTAERAGFTATGGGVATIRANVQQESKSGLAVINNENKIVVSTAMPTATRDTMLEQAGKLPAGQDGLIDIQKDNDGTALIGFSVPIFSIQGDNNANSQIGRVVGVKTIDDNLFGLLRHPGTMEKTLETVLVRTGDDKLEYISPLQDGTGPLTKQVERDKNKFAEAILMDTTGNFLSDKRDYRGKPVLATSRPVAGTPWTLIVKTDRMEALSESSQRRASMVIFFFLIIVIIVLIVIAVWWHAHSKRSMMMSYYFKRMAAQATAQEQLLRLVADHQPEPIYIVDRQHIYRFANRKTLDEAGTTREHVSGKTLIDIRGAAQAEQIGAQCDKALKTKQIVYDLRRNQEGADERVIRSAYIPLDHIPIITLPEFTPGVLVVEMDLSEVVHEREARLNTHHQLVQTLLRLVDMRDPFAANHSMLVSQVAYEVAVDMDLDHVTVDTTRFAGSLMNIGKIVVPTDLLTKTESLTNEEKRIIRDSINAAADLLKDISFDGPVAETLRQWQEKWDGTGPLGLQGESILISARIIAVANAFIGMISPRSWRTAIPIEAANKFLLGQCDTHFDRRVVVALINYVENHSGKDWIKKIIDSQKNVA